MTTWTEVRDGILSQLDELGIVDDHVRASVLADAKQFHDLAFFNGADPIAIPIPQFEDAESQAVLDSAVKTVTEALMRHSRELFTRAFEMLLHKSIALALARREQALLLTSPPTLH